MTPSVSKTARVSVGKLSRQRSKASSASAIADPSPYRSRRKSGKASNFPLGLGLVASRWKCSKSLFEGAPPTSATPILAIANLVGGHPPLLRYYFQKFRVSANTSRAKNFGRLSIQANKKETRHAIVSQTQDRQQDQEADAYMRWLAKGLSLVLESNSR